jgi:hypothetical protein
MKKEYRDDPALVRIWDLCVHSQRYGAQEMVLDCMEREKGIYVGDGCYSALVHLLLTGDDSIARKLIDDAFFSSFITDGLVTCVDCSYMQEIADYPLILVDFVLWHYRLVGDREYLAQNYPKICRLLEAYRRDYERDGLLSHLDKWCVVAWPANYRDGYAVDITEGKVCEDVAVTYKIVLGTDRVALSDKPFYNYYHRPGSITISTAAEITDKTFHFSRHTEEIYAYIREHHPAIVPQARYLRVRSLSHILLLLEQETAQVRKQFASEYRHARKELKKHTLFIVKSSYFGKKEKITDLLLNLGLYRHLRPIFHRA